MLKITGDILKYPQFQGEEMKTITKYRLFNPYVLLTIFTLFASLLISWAFESEFINILFFMDYHAEDLIGNPSEIRRAFLWQIATWEVYIDTAMSYLVHFMPIFASLPILAFSKELQSYFDHGRTRFSSLTKEKWKGVLSYSFIAGLSISLAFTLFFLIGSFYMIPSIENIGGFASIFPNNFYNDYPLLFFLFMTWTAYFGFGFSFGFLACGIAIWTEKNYYILLIPMLYYFIANYISAMFFGLLPLHVSAVIVAFNTLYGTSETFVPLFPILALGILLVASGIKKTSRIPL